MFFFFMRNENDNNANKLNCSNAAATKTNELNCILWKLVAEIRVKNLQNLYTKVELKCTILRENNKQNNRLVSFSFVFFHNVCSI